MGVAAATVVRAIWPAKYLEVGVLSTSIAHLTVRLACEIRLVVAMVALGG